MIGRITGVIVARHPPEIVLDVGGIGYEIQVPLTTFFELPETGSELTLYTHFVVREDAQLLYGFAQERDRQLFRSLIKVSGVGPKLALGILSGMDAESFVQTVKQDDVATLVKLPGVGKKTAERLLIEMRDRLKDWIPELEAVTPLRVVGDPAAHMLAEAESALVALGYKPAEASRAVAAANDDSVEKSEELIRRALQSMVKAR